MYDLMLIDSHRKIKKILKFLSIILLLVLIIVGISIFFINRINSEKVVKYGAFFEIRENLKEDFLKQKELYSKQIKSNNFTEEQYDNIINIYSKSPEKTVYLTFDDGPSQTVTPLILDLLKQEKIPVTFFVLGTNVDKYPEIVKREYSEGHFIANHGYSHKYSEIYENTDTIINDYFSCEQSLKRALNDENFSTNVYRFPGGSTGGKYHDIKAEGKEVLKENNIAYLDWNALTCDAEGTPTKESIIENLKQTVGSKDVVVLLMHDSSSKILTYETLPEVIAFFRDNGYSFKTLYDVF